MPRERGTLFYNPIRWFCSTRLVLNRLLLQWRLCAYDARRAD